MGIGAAGGGFDQIEELIERLRCGPGEQKPYRWTLQTIRDSIDWLKGYSLSGVWQVLTRHKIRLRSAQVQHWSPDTAYRKKERRVKASLCLAVRSPGEVVTLFLDEMGFFRWPDPSRVWSEAAPAQPPLAVHGDATNQQWRLVGALNAVTGQVTYLQNYIVGRKQMAQMYQRIAAAYPDACRIYVIQDNWSIHSHPDVLAAMANFQQIQPVWLPTYAHWLNPIEKLWRWLRQAVLRMHRLASDWPALKQQLIDFLDQFAHGSEELLKYVGLSGNGRLARVLAESRLPI